MKQTVLAGILLALTIFAACGQSSGKADAYFSDLARLSDAQTKLIEDFAQRFEKAESGQSVVSIFSQFTAASQELGKSFTEMQEKYKDLSRESLMAAFSNNSKLMQEVQVKSQQANMRLELAFFSNQHRETPEVKKLFTALSNQAQASMTNQGPQ
jgi:hypothetical protein